MWFDPFVKLILCSPLHGILSRNTMLFTFTGRRSGKEYTTPVNFFRVRFRMAPAGCMCRSIPGPPGCRDLETGRPGAHPSRQGMGRWPR